MTPRPAARDAAGALARYLARAPRLPKYAQLRSALAAAIDDGLWAAGMPLPTELELVGMTPYSLGTVQRAVRALVDEGYVTRVKGRGTFVTERRRGLSQPFLHLRFLDDSGAALLPAYPRVVGKRRMAQAGPWSAFLGANPKDIVCIERVFDVAGEFRAFTRFYLDARRFGGFAALPPGELARVNYKLALARDYNLPPIAYEQVLALEPLPAAVARILHVRRGTIGATLRVRARTGPAAPLYYHELYVPPNRREMVLPEMTLPTGR